MSLVESGVNIINEDTIQIKDMCACYFLRGSKKNLLIDTGAGFYDVKKLIKPYDDKELIVINTHGHFDHIGNNNLFDNVYINKEDLGIFNLQNSSTFRQRVLKVLPWFLRFGKIKKIVLKQQNTPINFISDGDIIDLGDRIIEIITTPGHTKGSICLLDKTNRILFTGDSVCDWGILLYMDYSCSPKVFLESMLKLKNREDEFDYICPGHRLEKLDKKYIDYYIECAEKAINGIDAKLLYKDVSFAYLYQTDKVRLYTKVTYE